MDRDSLIDGVEFDENRAIHLTVLIGFRGYRACQETAAACLDCGSCKPRVRRQLGGIRNLTIAGDPIRFGHGDLVQRNLLLFAGRYRA